MLFIFALIPVWASRIVPVNAVQPAFTSLNYPVSFKFAPDGRLFYNEKNTGNIRVIQNGILQSAPFATLSVSTAGPEQGLLGIAFDPNFVSNGFVFVYSTYFDGTFYHGHITRYTAIGNTGTNPVNIFDVTDPTPATTNHNGGYLKFGPDGKLYVQIGEFADESQSENLTSNAGKVLRMNSDGTVPSDNPFSGSLVYAYGFRNGFGMDFDPYSGKLIAAEAGPDRNDKVEFITAGGNYCWPIWYNGGNTTGCQNSILSFTPTVTPTGLAYTAPNTVYFGEYNTGNLLLLHLTTGGTVATVGVVATVGSSFNGILSVELGPGGHVYFSTPTTIYKISHSSSSPLDTLSDDVTNAPAESVVFVLPDWDLTHPKPQGVGDALQSDWTALGYIYGTTRNQQAIVMDTNSTYFDSTTGAPKVFNATLVLFAGPLVNAAVHYYESSGISPTYWLPVAGSHTWHNRNVTTVASLSSTATTSDMFLLEYFIDTNGNKVFVVYGFGWKGTYAGGVFFKDHVLPNLTEFTHAWYVFKWSDSNNNGLPELAEISTTPISSGD